jgi:hypothetical protein
MQGELSVLASRPLELGSSFRAARLPLAPLMSRQFKRRRFSWRSLYHPKVVWSISSRDALASMKKVWLLYSPVTDRHVAD